MKYEEEVKADALATLMVAFKDVSAELKRLFTYVDTKFEVKNDKVKIELRADNEPR